MIRIARALKSICNGILIYSPEEATVRGINVMGHQTQQHWICFLTFVSCAKLGVSTLSESKKTAVLTIVAVLNTGVDKLAHVCIGGSCDCGGDAGKALSKAMKVRCCLASPSRSFGNSALLALLFFRMHPMGSFAATGKGFAARSAIESIGDTVGEHGPWVCLFLALANNRRQRRRRQLSETCHGRCVSAAGG